MPVASDLPMIDTIIVEVPNPRHPYGVRGVGEVPIVPPLAAVANAIATRTGVRMTDLPMSRWRRLRSTTSTKQKGGPSGRLFHGLELLDQGGIRWNFEGNDDDAPENHQFRDALLYHLVELGGLRTRGILSR